MKHLNNLIFKYHKELFKLLEEMDKKELVEIIKIIKKCYINSNTVFVCGNGGSASIANHWICDHQEGIKKNSKLKPKVLSLSSNLELITATANDFDYKYIFKNNIQNYIKKNDVLVCFSVSGNSKNILEVMKYAKKKGVSVILFSGFRGGKASSIADLELNFNSKNYGVVEDCFQSVMHVIAQSFYDKN